MFYAEFLLYKHIYPYTAYKERHKQICGAVTVTGKAEHNNGEIKIYFFVSFQIQYKHCNADKYKVREQIAFKSLAAFYNMPRIICKEQRSDQSTVFIPQFFYKDIEHHN